MLHMERTGRANFRYGTDKLDSTSCVNPTSCFKLRLNASKSTTHYLDIATLFGATMRVRPALVLGSPSTGLAPAAAAGAASMVFRPTDVRQHRAKHVGSASVCPDPRRTTRCFNCQFSSSSCRSYEAPKPPYFFFLCRRWLKNRLHEI